MAAAAGTACCRGCACRWRVHCCIRAGARAHIHTHTALPQANFNETFKFDVAHPEMALLLISLVDCDFNKVRLRLEEGGF